MTLPKGTPEEALRSAAGTPPDQPTPKDIGGSAEQLFPKTRHLHIADRNHLAARAAEEDHHRLFHLPDHDMHAVVAIEQKQIESVDNYLVLHAECWEVDADGNRTGLQASVGTHTVPHHMLVEAGGEVSLDDVIEHMTAIMVERLAKRKAALSALDSRPVKQASKEKAYRKPALPRGITDPHAI